MKKAFLLFSVLFFSFIFKIKAQEGFRFLDRKKTKQVVRFKLINNLIVIPLEINGKKLSFILDSGVSRTILFNITKNDSIGLNNVEKVQLQGLGRGKPVDALFSKNNILSIKNLIGRNESIHVILEDKFDLSSKMGITIHGIIGYSLLRNFIVKINYSSKKITFYNSKSFKYKKCRKCEVFPLQFYRMKPYINAQVQLDTIGNKLTDVKLLIDSGGTDAVWLFEDTKEDIKTPNRFFNDVLGEGLSGLIYGNRSRIPKIKLNSFEIKKPTVSFLDSVSTKNARLFEERNGSIGAGILKKFIVWFDYPNKNIMLKKNGSFNKKINYNMSGLDIVYNGKILVKEKNVKKFSEGENKNTSFNYSINFITNFSHKFRSSFKIKNVVLGSPAHKAGLQKDDIILKINNSPAYNYTLQKINEKLQKKDNLKITMLVDRKGEKIRFEFRLKNRI